MRDECDICRGRQIIRLPIYRRKVYSAYSPEIQMPDVIEDVSREFPCPQCSEINKEWKRLYEALKRISSPSTVAGMHDQDRAQKLQRIADEAITRPDRKP